MRRFFFPLFIIVVALVTSCQPKVNVEKETKAILAVLQEEAEGLKTMDKERVYATHMQGSQETRMELGVYGFNIYEGWDEIESLLGDYLEGGPHMNHINAKENVILKITGNSAWLTCDNVWRGTTEDGKDEFSNIQIVFMEKVKGEWKISFSAYYNKPVAVPGIVESFD